MAWIKKEIPEDIQNFLKEFEALTLKYDFEKYKNVSISIPKEMDPEFMFDYNDSDEYISFWGYNEGVYEVWGETDEEKLEKVEGHIRYYEDLISNLKKELKGLKGYE